MKTEKVTIKSEVVFSDDLLHRYSLRKVWEPDKPEALVISIIPSNLYNETSDLTTMLIMNNVSHLGFGSFTLCNLFSLCGIDLKKCKDVKGLTNSDNNDMIASCLKRITKNEDNTIIIAWGKVGQTKRNQKREDEVLELIKPYFERTRVIGDENGRFFLHPLTPAIRDHWTLRSWDDYQEYMDEQRKVIEQTEKKKLRKNPKVKSETSKIETTTSLPVTQVEDTISVA